MKSGASVMDISATNDTSVNKVTVILAILILETLVGIKYLTLLCLLLFSWRFEPLWMYFPQPGSGL
jgi:hypothetical protein